MNPKSFSASSLDTAALCLARYHAENIVYARSAPNDAARGGTSVHGALEPFVKLCYIDKTHEPTLELLLDLYKISYATTFGTSEFTSDVFKDGTKMLKAWHERTDFSTFSVLSVEVKEAIQIPTSLGKKPFNYIFDRLDQLDEHEYRVNDYKTNRFGLSPSELKDKVQARCYALAAQIKFPDAKRIWVEFDMLRHNGPVGVTYTREDNIETWRWLKREAQRIIDTPEDGKIPETLNAMCHFCVRKPNCGTVRKNIEVDGLMSLENIPSLVDRRGELEAQAKAAKAALDEVDAVITAYAQQQDVFEIDGENSKVIFKMSSRRSVDGERVAMVIGPELMRKYGVTPSMRLSDFDALIDDPSLTDQQRKQLSGFVYSKQGEPRPATKPLPPIR